MVLEPFKKWHELIETLDEKWNKSYEIMKKYVNEHKKLPERKHIGNWLYSQKADIRKGKITQERNNLLMKIEPFKEWYDNFKK